MSGGTSRIVRDLYKRIDDLDRRLAASHLQGRVAEIDGQRVRLEIFPPDPRTGKPFLSPWVQVQESAGDGVGGYSTHVPVAVGETMRLLSPHGELGPQSVAVRDGYTDVNPRPTDQDQQLVIKHGDTEIRLDGSSIRLTVGGGTLSVSADEVLTTVRTRLANGTRPVHFKGAVDSAGDIAIEGETQVLV